MSSSCAGFYFVDDAWLQAVQTAFENGTEVGLEFTNATSVVYKGKAVITSMSLDAGQDDVVSYTISFEGSGKLGEGNE